MVDTPLLTEDKMAVKRVHERPRYIGLSTDDKPTSAVVGAEYWERDTKRNYVVYDKTAGVASWTLEK